MQSITYDLVDANQLHRALKFLRVWKMLFWLSIAASLVPYALRQMETASVCTPAPEYQINPELDSQEQLRLLITHIIDETH